ncbi:Dyp-type peroxidase [Pyxidicoccus xibeiensis]|uniref:Dyp-type peroxidase n=1 Tax=Pyxidicoccus xibeiensis TaxID=2906759 RepID=UPI0020A768F2|nr:Dyp-type peroxidase domain-containing protein [Pyxidicoccus xibeiensis]MCP3137860.1 Dyp-type peroxidase [Pyxidicoccus xibeiensis]
MYSTDLPSRRTPPTHQAPPELDLKDVQGLLLHGYRELTELALVFLRIDDAPLCRQWLGELARGAITTADPVEHQRRRRELGHEYSRVNVALTPRGLATLGLPEEVLATFPLELREGMARRAREHLRDVDANAPETWQLGGTRFEDDLHVLLLLYAWDARRMEALLHDYRARAAQQGLREVHLQRGSRRHREGDPHGYYRDHFGFLDGLSQPRLEGFEDPAGHPRDYDRPVKRGEFILGHLNEYGEYPLSPCVPERLDAANALPPTPGREGWRELGRNGSYLVVRKLEQHVREFEDFLSANASLAPEGRPEDQREWVAAKLVGRWRNGAPLVARKHGPLRRLLPFLFRAEKAKPPHVTERTPRGIDNGFRYARDDPRGLGCPVTAHARRCNPRDAQPPKKTTSLEVTRRHRLLRRGFSYWDDSGQGLLFLAFNTSLSRQFEFIQRSWIHFDQLGGMEGAEDPLSGDGGGRLVIPQQPVRQCVADLQRFVSMRGGGYFFMPGMNALRFLAAWEPAPPA